MRKPSFYLIFLLILLLPGCSQLKDLWEEPAKQLEKMQKENQSLQKETILLRERLAQSEAEGIMNKVIVSLYDLRHALEKYAQQNNGDYPLADNINDLQARLKNYLPESFEIEAIYIERIRSQQRGYIMIANVKGREIVVSNLL